MSKYFVFCHIDGDQQPTTMAKYGVTGYPTILFLNREGSVIHKIVGARPLNVFLQEMEKARSAAGG